MTEGKAEYKTIESDTQDAMEMLGTGYDHPSLEIHPQQTVIRRHGWEMREEVVPAFVKISTGFKQELLNIGGTALKVWLFIALSINRNTEQAHPGIRTIGKACDIKSMNTVTAAIKELEGLGLLTVNREDRKYNIYQIPDYVSANSKTASKSDTDSDKLPQSNKQTASAHGGLTREPENNNQNWGKMRKEAKERKAKQQAEKKDPVDFILTSSEKEQAYKAMEERVFKSTGLAVNETWRRERVIDFLIEKDAAGETIEIFAAKCKADPFNMPKWFQIAQKPSLLKDTWGLAFVQPQLEYDWRNPPEHAL